MIKRFIFACAFLISSAVSAFAATFSFEFTMPATEFSFTTGSQQTSGPQVGVTSVLELVARNGSSISTNQSYTGNDFVAARLKSVSDTAFLDLTSYLSTLFVETGTVQFVTTDSSGVATLSLPNNAPSSGAVLFGGYSSELIQIGIRSTPSSGPFQYYLSANRDLPIGGGFLGAGVNGLLTIVGSTATDVSNSFPEPSPVPLPATGFLLVGSIGGLAAFRKRQSLR